MRKLILYMHVSLDGFVQGPKDWDINWIIHNEEIEEYNKGFMKTVDTVLFGRVTYQGMESFWPSVPENPSSTKNEIDYAHWIGKTPKIVFSKSLDRVKWKNTRLIKAQITEEVSRLKQQPGGDMLINGSPALAQTFMQLGLIDEYRLNVNPIVLGSGKPLFKDIKDRIHLQLLKTHTFDSGVVGLVYSSGDQAF